MNVLYLLRHSLTRANERRLYCGWTDLPLSAAGIRLAKVRALEAPLPPFDLRVDSGLRRAKETVFYLSNNNTDRSLSDLREMNFGRFEMRGYEELRDDPDYKAWIMDETGHVACPGGESRALFCARVLRGGGALLRIPGERVLAVCHGGVIVTLMKAWFPDEERGFYEWQPGPCRGYRVVLDEGNPISYEEV